MGGAYFLDEPLIFTSRDSGTRILQDIPSRGILDRELSVSYLAYPGETPVISGGKLITGWKEDTLNGKTVWVTEVPEVKQGKWYFQQLFVNGERRFRTRVPHDGFFQIEKPVGLPKKTDPWEKQARFFCYSGDIQQWHNLQDVEIVLLQGFVACRAYIQSFKPKTCLVSLDRKSRYGFNCEYNNYYVENVFEALEKPGQWYLDRTSGILYYLPMKGESIENSEIVVPYLEQLILYEGDPVNDQFVEAVHFEGITFSHNEWLYPDGQSNSLQSENEVPGAVSLHGAKYCSFEHCSFSNLGTYGIELSDSCSDITIKGNKISDLGAGGIKIWHGCQRNTISDNDIGHGGHIFHSAVGILIGKSGGNKVAHNNVHDFYYAGISLGWVWGYSDSESLGNIVEYNHVHDLGRKRYLDDFGGIYTLGVCQGTRLCNNIIHDVYASTDKCVASGFHLDEGSSDILVENNLVYCTDVSAGLHFGRGNMIRNNIFVFSRKNMLGFGWSESHCSFCFQNNIVYLKHGNVFIRGYKCPEWQNRFGCFKNNLYYNPGRKKMIFVGMDFKAWQKRGMDSGSIIADPCFVDPQKRDFRLKQSSATRKIGFQSFDLSNVGPRKI